jgi:2,3-bisphosphoglycerate-independent phosphoglycerate mutase
MKAAEITDAAVKAVHSGNHRFIRLNYANGDMVGHTGVEAAIRIGVETVDICLGRLLEAVAKAGGIAVVTADHGNADCMWRLKDKKKIPMVAHTLNPVPFIIKDYGGKNRFGLNDMNDRGLANVAATICLLLGYHPPPDYEPPLVSVQA